MRGLAVSKGLYPTPGASADACTCMSPARVPVAMRLSFFTPCDASQPGAWLNGRDACTWGSVILSIAVIPSVTGLWRCARSYKRIGARATLPASDEPPRVPGRRIHLSRCRPTDQRRPLSRRHLARKHTLADWPAERIHPPAPVPRPSLRHRHHNQRDYPPANSPSPYCSRFFTLPM
jgi:hypothetical protein